MKGVQRGEKNRKMLAKDDILPFQLELKVSYIIVGRWFSLFGCETEFLYIPFFAVSVPTKYSSTFFFLFCFFSHSHFSSSVFFFYKTICVLSFVWNICRTFRGAPSPYQIVLFYSYIHLAIYSIVILWTHISSSISMSDHFICSIVHFIVSTATILCWSFVDFVIELKPSNMFVLNGNRPDGLSVVGHR